MKSRLGFALSGSLLMFGACAAPAVAGRYVCDRDRTPKDTLDLEAGGGFTLQEDGATLNGRYSLKGQLLSLDLPGRNVPPFRLEGTVLVDQAGGRWTKE